MILVLMGCPGAGKGSVSELLEKHYNILHISTGDMFREAIKEETPVGLEAKSFIDKGLLVPDYVTCNLMKERLQKPDCKNGFMLDGFPRNEYQAEQLDVILKELGLKITKVINMVADDEFIVNRLANRRVCPKCSYVYHLINKKPKVEGICDYDQEALIQRTDDNRETILNRLAVYHGFAKPLEDYYSNKGLLVEIDGKLSIPDAFEEAKKILGDKK